MRYLLLEIESPSRSPGVFTAIDLLNCTIEI
jgi:hypothetical protein